jgi:hypothetical protein
MWPIYFVLNEKRVKFTVARRQAELSPFVSPVVVLIQSVLSCMSWCLGQKYLCQSNCAERYTTQGQG